MLVVLGMVAVAALVLFVSLMLVLRSVVLDESRTEVRLRAPEAHTLAHVVPEGIDPASLRVALAHEGFAAVVSTDAGVERLLVECEKGDRDRVRALIAGVERRIPAGNDGGF